MSGELSVERSGDEAKVGRLTAHEFSSELTLNELEKLFVGDEVDEDEFEFEDDVDRYGDDEARF